MKRIISILALSWFFMLNAEAEKIRMSLEECISNAFENNLSLKISRENVQKFKHLKGTAFDVPNTSIELSQDATDGGSMENGLKFSQEFEFPTVYIAKHKALKADFELAQGELDESRNRLAGEVSAAYYSVVFLRAKVGILREMLGCFDEFYTLASRRLEAGESSRLEVLNASRLRAICLEELRAAELEEMRNSLTLSALVGLEGIVEPAENELQVLDLPDLSVEFMPEQTLRGRLKVLELNRSEKNLGTAKQEFMPGLFLSATSQLLIKSFNPYGIDRQRFEKGNFMGFQVGITIPLFFGAKKSKLEAARHEVAMAKIKMDEESLALNNEWISALYEFSEAQKSLAYYEQEGLQDSEDQIRLAKISYEYGEINYVEFIENVKVAWETRISYLVSIDRFNQAVITLNTLRGII